jgi:predicted DsbA family dithiol-disulfide isomerase
MTDVHIDLVSDPVCPWCWLGLKYWEQARALVSDIQTTTVLRPYQLDPNLPRSGADYRDYMRAKFGEGPNDKFQALKVYLEQAGPEVGITFDFKSITRRPNTLDAHRLIRWAQGQGLGEAVIDRLHSAFFKEKADIGAHKVLTQIASDQGLDGALVGELLNSERDTESVLKEEKFYRELGVQGVPCFIFNGRFAVSGAESPNVLADAIKQAASLPAPDTRPQ